MRPLFVIHCETISQSVLRVADRQFICDTRKYLCFSVTIDWKLSDFECNIIRTLLCVYKPKVKYKD